MQILSKLCRTGLRTVASTAICCLATPLLFGGPPEVQLVPVQDAHDLLSHASQGYLGVVVNDMDSDRAAALKLKDARGAEIVKLDQDGPAAKAGLKAHDVVVQMNGQQIEGVEQLRRMLRETPAGRTVPLIVVRDGQPMNFNVQLADRNALAAKSLDDIEVVPEPIPLPRVSSGFVGNYSRNENGVGVEVQPLSTQLADYFGVKNGTGLLVDSVFENTPAANAGFKAADVILKVNGQPVVSVSDWSKALRNNRGKQIQVTVMRNKKEQTLTMTAGEPKNKSELELREFETYIPDGQVAAIDPEAIAAQIREAMKGFDADAVKLQAEQAAHSIDQRQIEKAIEQSRKEWEQNRGQIEKQMQQMQEQMKSWHWEEMD